jgi:hypothetical protein
MTFISHFSIHLLSPGKETDAVEVKPEVVVASTSSDSTEQGSSSLKDPLLAVGDIIAAQIVSAEETLKSTLRLTLYIVRAIKNLFVSFITGNQGRHLGILRYEEWTNDGKSYFRPKD